MTTNDQANWGLGVGIDVGVNSFVTGLDESLSGKGIPNGILLGVIVPWNDFTNDSGSAHSRSAAEVGETAETILLGMKLDCLCRDVSYGNWSDFWGPAFIGVDNLDLYSPGEIPNGNGSAQIAGSNPRTMNFVGQLYPNGVPWDRSDYKKNYPLTTYADAGMTPDGWSNYLYVDGHAKWFADQRLTDPDPVNRPEANQWDAREKRLPTP